MMPNNDPLLAEFINATWLPHIRERKSSWKLDENMVKNHILPEFGVKRLAAISEEDVRRWLVDCEKHKCAPATRNRRFHVLKSIFSLAMEKGLLAESPTARLRSKRVKKTRWPSLDREYLSSLLDALNRSPKREAKAITLLLLTGAHKSEIIKARWENLFLHEGLLLAPRVGTPPYRKIWLSLEAQDILRSIPRQQDSPWIFPGRDITKPISDIFLFWKELRAELGLEALSIRDLRYVFADWQLKSGMPRHTLQRCMGINDTRGLDERQLCAGVRYEPLPT